MHETEIRARGLLEKCSFIEKPEWRRNAAFRPCFLCKRAAQILLNSDSDFPLLLKGPLHMLGDFAGDTPIFSPRRLWLNVLATQNGAVHELASDSMERVQEEMLSCVFHERRVLYSRRERLTKEVHCNQAPSSRLLFLGSPDLDVFLKAA